tara:strand:- start:2940 stop:3119 length:180 start_codon:yes stop_codon:yes gene_type:complete
MVTKDELKWLSDRAWKSSYGFFGTYFNTNRKREAEIVLKLIEEHRVDKINLTVMSRDHD